MITEVHLKDEHTVLQLPSRKALRALLEHAPGDDWKGETAFVMWSKRGGPALHSDLGTRMETDPGEWKPLRLTFLRAASIALVCAAQHPCDGIEAIAEKRHGRWVEQTAEASG